MTEQADEVVALARVEVGRVPRRARLVACWIVMVAMVAVLVAGIVMGAPVSFLSVLVILALSRAIKAEAAATEWRVVEVSVRRDGTGVLVVMPGARLFSGRYVDQRYSCVAGDLEGAGVDETGTFRLRARRLVSEAVEDGAVLDRREHEFGEVSFRPVSREEAVRLSALFSA
ncbi:hypothetical protein [Thermophilibacter sp.]